MAEYLLGLDNGSTVIKAAIFDLAGNEIAVARTNGELISHARGHYQRNLDKVKADNITVIKEVLSKSRLSGDDIAGVAITGHGNGLYLIDENGVPTYDGVSSADSRAQSIVDEWYSNGVAKSILPLTLQSIWAGQSPAIIAWFAEHEPEVLEKSRWMLLAKDYIRFLFTGEIYLEKSDISGTSMYNVVEGRYDDVILSALGILDYKYLLPEVRSATDICGCVTAEMAEATGLSAGTPVAGGIFDIAAVTLATGIVNASSESKIKLNIIVGTWSINQYITTKPKIDDKLFMTSLYVTPGHWLVTEGSATSASNLEWFVNNFLQLEKEKAASEGLSVFDICNDAVKSTSPEDSNIIFLPFLYGSNVGAQLSGTFLNLRMRDKRQNVIRAIYEGIVFSHRYHIEKLFTSLPKGLEVMLAGGGANSKDWVQMFADVLQVPVETTTCSELGALGAAMSAGVAVDCFNDIESAAEMMVHVKDRVEPDPMKKGVYEKKYQLYLEFIKKLL